MKHMKLSKAAQAEFSELSKEGRKSFQHMLEGASYARRQLRLRCNQSRAQWDKDTAEYLRATGV